MKTLYLIRHAKSSWDDAGLNDFDRPLNARGARDAPRMGTHLNKLDVYPDLILASPAVRALNTAEIIAEEIDYPRKEIEKNDNIYHAGTSELMKILESVDDSVDVLFLVGHNPGFTDLANKLSIAHIDNIPTCGIFCVEFDMDSWEDIGNEKGEFKLFDYPKKLQ